MIRNNLLSVIIRFSGTVLQLLSGILISRFSNPETTAYYFLILSTVWICVYSISFGFPNHIFIRISETDENTNIFSLLNNYLISYSRLLIYALPLILISVFFLQQYYLINFYSIIFIFLTAFGLSSNRFCSESLKGFGNQNIGIFLDRTLFPFLLLIQIIFLFFQENITIQTINLLFLYSSFLSFIISYITSFLFLEKKGIKKYYKLDTTHLSGQYFIELGEVVNNRLPIILLNIIFATNSTLIAGVSICFTLVSISGTINFALYPYFGRQYLKMLQKKDISSAKKMLIYSQLLSGTLYCLYFVLLFILGEYLLEIYNSEYIQYYNYLIFYALLMVINQFFGVSDYLMSLIRKDYYAILFKIVSLFILLLFAFIANQTLSIHWFLFATFFAVFIKNLFSYIFHFKRILHG